MPDTTLPAETVTPAMVDAGAQAIADAEHELADRAIRRYPVSWRRTLALAVLTAARRPTTAHAHHPPACGSDMCDGSRWTGNTDRVTCTGCRIAVTVAAERERIAQMAEQHKATYPLCERPGLIIDHLSFADLIRQGGPDA